MRVSRPKPCYCAVCDGANALRVTLDNPSVAQPATLALCNQHAEQLAATLRAATLNPELRIRS